MKILHVFKTYLPVTVGGIENMIYVLAQQAGKRGHETVVLTTVENDKSFELSGCKEVVIGNHRVIQAPRSLDVMSTPMSMRMMIRFHEIASEYDLIHYHFPWPFMDFLQAILPIKTPYIVTYHSDIVKQKLGLYIYGPLMRKFLNESACVVATSKNYLDTSPVLRGLSARMEVVPLGIDDPELNIIVDSDLRPSIVESCKISEPYFLFVGVLRYYKGLEFAIRAALASNTRLVIAGDGPERKPLEALAERLGANKVEFVGRVSDGEKDLLLQSCRAFLFPSHLRSEAFGVSLLEASAFAKPMICCDIGTGTNFVNKHKVTGLVVPPADVEELTKAMTLLKSDPALSREYGSNARKRFNTHFSGSQMADSYIDIYRSVLNI